MACDVIMATQAGMACWLVDNRHSQHDKATSVVVKMQKNAMHNQQQVGKLADAPAQAQIDKLPEPQSFDCHRFWWQWLVQ